ncbi:Lipid-A-disaccharide synthase [bioreactor metagenome]|uniref:lipid-A-disaccharide synthase n=1 Tax=bioreactor metagenome TaxID=1076179 RepID=A0A645BG63_9ZZZZ
MHSGTVNIWIMAGEASGDLYGAALARDLAKRGEASGLAVRVGGMGGPAMQAAGVQRTVDSTELGVVGVIEVVKHLFTFAGIFWRLIRTVKAERPDAVVLIDYPTFNLLFARILHWLKIPAIWYVSPHVWVWGKRRIPKLARLCRKMLVIFPFEPEVYAGSGLDTEFVGHPLIDMVEARRDPAIVRDPDLVALLPGSRSMEIRYLLEPMLGTAAALYARRPGLRFVLAAPREKTAAQCREVIARFRARHPGLKLPEIPVECGRTGYYLQAAGTGLAASGTVTVESAVAGLPLVVVYKLNYLTLVVFGVFVRLFRNAFTMVNIIADKPVFEEYLQYKVKPEVLVPALERILPGGPERPRVEREMNEVKALLGGEAGPQRLRASERAAAAVLRAIGKI